MGRSDRFRPLGSTALRVLRDKKRALLVVPVWTASCAASSEGRTLSAQRSSERRERAHGEEESCIIARSVIVPVERATRCRRGLFESRRPSRRRGRRHSSLQVMTADGLWAMDRRGADSQLGRPTQRGASERRRSYPNVRCEERMKAIIPAYAQLIGARAIVVDAYYGTTRSVAEHRSRRPLSRLSPVPSLCCHRGTRTRTMGAWQHQRGRRRGRFERGVRGRAENRRGSRGSTRRAPDDASCARELSRAFRFQRQRGMARGAQQLPGRQRQIAKRLESQARRLRSSGCSGARCHWRRRRWHRECGFRGGRGRHRDGRCSS